MVDITNRLLHSGELVEGSLMSLSTSEVINEGIARDVRLDRRLLGEGLPSECSTSCGGCGGEADTFPSSLFTSLKSMMVDWRLRGGAPVELDTEIIDATVLRRSRGSSALGSKKSDGSL